MPTEETAREDAELAQRYVAAWVLIIIFDKSGSDLAALHATNAERETPIKIGQVKYLSDVVEQDHRAIQRRTDRFCGSMTSTVRASRVTPAASRGHFHKVNRDVVNINVDNK